MAIFQTSGQAVHFSYVIQAYDASPQSQMAMIMRGVIQQISGKSSSIDFDGLSPLEVRGQCAMIRACVRSHLRPLEANAIEARYSRERDAKRLAIRALAEYYAPMLGINTSLALALIWRQHVEKSRKKDFTLRAIADDYGSSKDIVHRAATALNEHLDRLESMALSNLHARFVVTGVIEGWSLHKPSRFEPIIVDKNMCETIDYANQNRNCGSCSDLHSKALGPAFR